MPNTVRPNLDTMLAAVAVLPAPRTQAEWRRASTVMRTVRREARRIGRSCTPQIACGSSHRYLAAWNHGETTFCYNGPSPMSDVLMIAFNRRQRLLYGQSRIDDARGWARRSRSQGPVPLPDRRPATVAIAA